MTSTFSSPHFVGPGPTFNLVKKPIYIEIYCGPAGANAGYTLDYNAPMIGVKDKTVFTIPETEFNKWFGVVDKVKLKCTPPWTYALYDSAKCDSTALVPNY